MVEEKSDFGGLVNFEKIYDDEIKDESEDKLGFSNFTNTFTRYINLFKTPLVVGVYGEWGSGKSSFVTLALKELPPNNNEKLEPIIFDSWKYKEETCLWKSFLLHILGKLDYYDFIKSEDYIDIKNKLCYSEDKIHIDKIIMGSIIFISLLFAFISIYYPSIRNFEISIIVFIFSIMLGIVQINRSRGPISSFKEFEDKLQDLKDEFKIINDRVIVIIENLDRVEPKYALNLLESIKMLLNFENFIYIVPCDPNMLKEEIKIMYNNNNINSDDYLSKIITINYNLPPTKPEYTKIFISSIINPNKLSSNNTFEIFSKANIVNPRRIKKFLREADMAYRFMIASGEPEIKINPYLILVLIVSKYNFPDCYNLIINAVEFPSEIGSFRSILEYIFNPQDGSKQSTINYWNSLKDVVNFYSGMDLSDSDIRTPIRDEKAENIRQETIKFMKYFNYYTKERIIPTANEDFLLNDLPNYLLSISTVKHNKEPEAIEFGIGLSSDVEYSHIKGPVPVREYYKTPKSIKRKYRLYVPKERVFSAYGYSCAITKEKTRELLEVARIKPLEEGDIDNVENYIVLKTDLHRLLDKGLISIDENYKLHISPELRNTPYVQYDNMTINLPKEESYWPSKLALKYHYENKFKK
ncbi:MAG TPA: P-loop NTPase fold protein [Methanofastidiosum sp.]|nr:P-loop NTPase fold protein [Methanofastidiosum sp.]